MFFVHPPGYPNYKAELLLPSFAERQNRNEQKLIILGPVCCYWSAGLRTGSALFLEAGYGSGSALE